MRKRFRVLRLAARASKGIGALILIAGLILVALVVQGVLYNPFAPPAAPYSADILWSTAILLAPFLLGFLLLYGSGGALQVLMAIEENTRATRNEAPPGLPTEAEEPPQPDLEQNPQNTGRG